MSGADELNFFVTAFVSLFAIVNPFGNAPLFLSLTEGRSAKEQQRIALRAAVTSFLILAAFIFFGKPILSFFRVTIPAFQIAGGILIFIIGITMLRAFHFWARSTPEEEKEASEKQDVAVIPLGIPILTGPGAITTAMVLTFQRTGLEARLVVALSAVLVCLIAYLVFRESSYLMRIMGNTGINILTRLMGLLLTVIAAQFIINGLLAVFPFLSSGR